MKGIRFFGVWLVMLFAISAQAFTLPEQAACRPGKTVSLCLSLESGDSVTRFWLKRRANRFHLCAAKQVKPSNQVTHAALARAEKARLSLPPATG